MRNFQDTFETRKRSFISAFSICMTVPLRKDKVLIRGGLQTSHRFGCKRNQYQAFGNKSLGALDATESGFKNKVHISKQK